MNEFRGAKLGLGHRRGSPDRPEMNGITSMQPEDAPDRGKRMIS